MAQTRIWAGTGAAAAFVAFTAGAINPEIGEWWRLAAHDLARKDRVDQISALITIGGLVASLISAGGLLALVPGLGRMRALKLQADASEAARAVAESEARRARIQNVDLKSQLAYHERLDLDLAFQSAIEKGREPNDLAALLPRLDTLIDDSAKSLGRLASLAALLWVGAKVTDPEKSMSRWRLATALGAASDPKAVVLAREMLVALTIDEGKSLGDELPLSEDELYASAKHSMRALIRRSEELVREQKRYEAFRLATKAMELGRHAGLLRTEVGCGAALALGRALLHLRLELATSSARHGVEKESLNVWHFSEINDFALEQREISRSVCGASDPMTLSLTFLTAQTGAFSGQPDAAIGILEDLLPTHTSVLGRGHADVLATKRELVSLYRVSGRGDDAIAMQRSVVEDYLATRPLANEEIAEAKAMVRHLTREKPETDDALPHAEQADRTENMFNQGLAWRPKAGWQQD